MKISKILRLITPPIVIKFAKLAKNLIFKVKEEYEFVSNSWPDANIQQKYKGWNTESVLDAYKKNWPQFIKNLENKLPFGLSPESNNPSSIDLVFHNTLMVFAYSIALSSHNKSSFKMLDWGGGIGHYYLITKKLIPHVRIDYYCKDVKILADYGQSLFPESKFVSDEKYSKEKFDFILASGSLHYVEDWKRILDTFVECSNGYILLTRLPITLDEPFVYVQRPYKYGYRTEYLSWAINRIEILDYCQKIGFQFIREFVTGERPDIKNAPSFCEYRAFLFSNINDD